MEGLIIAPHEDVKIVSEMMFFRNPKEHGDAFIKQIKTHDPTLVVGIDFLFWFAYGGTGFEEPAQHRKEKFEHGLTLLSQISVPLVIGDLPDMRRAVGKMLSAHQVPSTETIKILNERLRAWALEHPNVIVLPAHDLIQSILNDEEVTVLNSTWAEGSKAQLVQPDMLHLTLEGAVVSTLMVIEALGTDCVETDPKVIMKNAAAIARLHNQ
jgi:hypothetical protein